MSLDFDFKDVKDFKQVTTHPLDATKWHPVADALVWLSMICGFNKITEANAGQIARRIQQYQLISGPYLRLGNGTGVYVTKEDVLRFIGMRTNASALTDAAWRGRMHTYMWEKLADGDWPGGSQKVSALTVYAEAAASKSKPKSAPKVKQGDKFFTTHEGERWLVMAVRPEQLTAKETQR